MSEETADEGFVKSFLSPIRSKKHLRFWIHEYLGIDFPDNHVDPDSNSSPVDWLWNAYKIVRDNQGHEFPNIVVYSSRDSYKTLSCSVFEILCMVHFGLTVAHMAAITSQSAKSVQYVNSFIRKINNVLEANGRQVIAQNTKNISVVDEEGETSYIAIIVCTLQGANSEHTNIMVIDEVDVVRFPQAYEEAKYIPGVKNGQHPVTVMTSTRKFAFGIMQKEIDQAKENDDLILHWNILDITERCPPERHLPDEPKETRYIHPDLPLRNISQKEYDAMHQDVKGDYERIKAHKGCASCKLLPVCQMRLSNRPKDNYGALWKPIDFTINQFGKVSPDSGEAQLLCRKPSSKGLVYGRFNEDENTITLKQAWEAYTGEPVKKHIMMQDLVDMLKRNNIQFYAGVDWGFRHYFAIIISAIVPTINSPKGEWWIFETFAAPDLEFADQTEVAAGFQLKYSPVQWYADTAQPMFIKTFKKKGMKCKKFTKDVDGGIEAVRGQIVDGKGKRKLKVLVNEKTKDLTVPQSPECIANGFLVKGFENHHFILDAQGRPTRKPDDEEYADVMDAMRYKGQNMFSARGKIIAKSSGPHDGQEAPQQSHSKNDATSLAADFLQNEIRKLTGGQSTVKNTTQKSKSSGIVYDFGNLETNDEGDL